MLLYNSLHLKNSHKYLNNTFIMGLPESISLIKSTFLGSFSIETPERIKSHLDDCFQTNPQHYKTLILALQDLISNSNNPAQKSTLDLMKSLVNSLDDLLSELENLKITEKEIPALYLIPKKAYVPGPSKDEKDAEIAQLQNEINSGSEILNNALNALNTIRRSDITELASFKFPPNTVVCVLELVCILMGHPKNCNRVCLRNASYISNLKNYNINSIDPNIILKVNKKIEEYRDLSYDKIRYVSLASAGIYQWIQGILAYDSIKSTIDISRAKLEALKKPAEEEVKQEISINLNNVRSPELSRALAPIIDREYEIGNAIFSINQEISNLDDIRIALQGIVE